MPSQQYGTTSLRELWCHYACKGSEYGDLGSACGDPGAWSDPSFYGKKIGGVPTVAVDAYHALERALMSEGYQASSVWSYNCRPIASSGKLSLHGMGIAIDIDPNDNPQANVPPFSGKFTQAQVEAVEGIRVASGKHLWWWGGRWSGSTLPDLMHWQLDVPPSEAVQIDWTTVPGGTTEPIPIPPDEEDGMILKEGANGNAVRSLQRALNSWSKANTKGWSVKVDGTWEVGSNLTDRVKEFQGALALDKTGDLDGLTASYLVGRYDPPDL